MHSHKNKQSTICLQKHVIRILDEFAIYAVNHLLTALNDLMLAKQSGQYRQKTIGHDTKCYRKPSGKLVPLPKIKTKDIASDEDQEMWRVT